MEGCWNSRREQKEPVTINIITTLAVAENTASDELTPPLYEKVNLDALERFIHSADDTACVTFEYRHWLVEVRGDNTVELTKFPEGE